MTAPTDRAAYQFLTSPNVIEMPTFAKPPDCVCSWSVVRPGVGMACISRLTRRSYACPHRHEVPEADQ